MNRRSFLKLAAGAAALAVLPVKGWAAGTKLAATSGHGEPSAASPSSPAAWNRYRNMVIKWDGHEAVSYVDNVMLESGPSFADVFNRSILRELHGYNVTIKSREPVPLNAPLVVASHLTVR